MTPLSPTARTRIGRLPERAARDRSDLYRVLDDGMICHLGLIVDGSPRVIPTGYGRLDDTLYLHGSTGASSLRAGPTQDVCVTVTHLDGIVIARSLFHHSMNYRSAVIFGTPRLVDDPDEKLAGLRAITENLSPGQWDVARQPTRKEMAAVSVLALSLDEASVKIRQGGPSDDDEDYALDVWAGVVPVHQTFGEPSPDPVLRPGIPVPGHIAHRANGDSAIGP
ncbi:pyridoxamine 5'-phosphate oxidase family protein [Actinomadura sp. KC06]|uniref:pyridoxamine 5'-phosphate oxidase family protein n=1 Tax=Actinomadura sp. KC06 TaxID=2530369 RepID=UPI0010529D05|nr:pyridoxamine 5'-phosphate oxidase family protein [Actinomadura sp. KC06]TDD27015.1 pyridoxamine 5'-phosphate oxidase family protein [Actinomadura sp. KC06]